MYPSLRGTKRNNGRIWTTLQTANRKFNQNVQRLCLFVCKFINILHAGCYSVNTIYVLCPEIYNLFVLALKPEWKFVLFEIELDFYLRHFLLVCWLFLWLSLYYSIKSFIFATSSLLGQMSNQYFYTVPKFSLSIFVDIGYFPYICDYCRHVTAN